MFFCVAYYMYIMDDNCIIKLIQQYYKHVEPVIREIATNVLFENDKLNVNKSVQALLNYYSSNVAGIKNIRMVIVSWIKTLFIAETQLGFVLMKNFWICMRKEVFLVILILLVSDYMSNDMQPIEIDHYITYVWRQSIKHENNTNKIIMDQTNIENILEKNNKHHKKRSNSL